MFIHHVMEKHCDLLGGNIVLLVSFFAQKFHCGFPNPSPTQTPHSGWCIIYNADVHIATEIACHRLSFRRCVSVFTKQSGGKIHTHTMNLSLSSYGMGALVCPQVVRAPGGLEGRVGREPPPFFRVDNSKKTCFKRY